MPRRPRSTLPAMLLLWVAFYASFTLFMPPLLDDADSVHAEVAREMLLRHDYVTMYANGIRYLEKAPLLYWSMALSMKLAMLFGARSPVALAAAARFPIALDVFGLAWLVEMLARRMFRSARAGLYAALMVLSSFGIFIFTHLVLPDAGVCLWIALAMVCFWRTEEREMPGRGACLGFAAACALNVLTKGLIGVVFPVGIVVVYLLLTRGVRGAWRRVAQMHIVSSLLVFLLIAAPWHILAGLANPTQGHPAPFVYAGGHWQVPLPTDGNVHGWFWFYFVNEHLLRYLNMRLPRDYDTVPLGLFWGLCLAWLFPWSAFLFQAVAGSLRKRVHAIRVRLAAPRQVLEVYSPQSDPAKTFLLVWAALPLLFFSLSTRQEYYVLPSLPALLLLLSGWLARTSEAATKDPTPRGHLRGFQAGCGVLLAFGTLYAAGAVYFLLHTRAAAADVDLAPLLAQNPADYALSMGHFLDLNATALAKFHPSLIVSGLSLFLGPLVAFVLSRRGQMHAAFLTLTATAAGLFVASHLALQMFSTVLSSAQLAEQVAPQVRADDIVAIHGEYESGSSLAFYLQRDDLHIIEGRSANLWYGSFFPDAPHIFETPQTLAAKWNGPQRIFLWQATLLPDAPTLMRDLPGPVYVVANGGGKEILSNQPNR